MGHEMGSQLGTVLDVGLHELFENAKIVKVKILHNILNPIRAGMYIGNDQDGINWIDFRYENLPMFYFGCGLVGHIQDNCRNIPIPFEGGTNPRGAWLRSKDYGRRFVERQEKTFFSNSRKSLSGGQFSPIPKALLNKFSKMNINKSGGKAPDQGFTQAHTPPPKTHIYNNAQKTNHSESLYNS